MEKKYNYPLNKKHFKKLIPFAKKILFICKNNKINSIIYGSFAHFYLTKDKINVNDIDIIISKKDFDKVACLFEKNKIHFRYLKAYYDNGMSTIIIKKGKLKVEIDEVGSGYPKIKEESLSKNVFNKIDFYGINVKMITLNQLEEIYTVAIKRTRDNKAKISKKN